jgi:hypothetical protein
MDIPRIIVPAFRRYIQDRSQVCNKRLLMVGTRYGGSSMTSGDDMPLNLVPRRIFTEVIAVKTPRA